MANQTEEKQKALGLAMSQIERQFGKGSIMRLGDRVKINVDIIPTGSISLDYALGIWGVPRGRIIEIFGPESSGKTTLALHIIAEAQKLGGLAAFVDAEHALDPGYARRLGVDTVNLLVPANTPAGTTYDWPVPVLSDFSGQGTAGSGGYGKSAGIPAGYR